jgi:flagellar biosynthetic protein FliR
VNIPIDQNYIEAVALISVRIVLFLIIAPPFSYQWFPLQVKGMLSVLLALVVAPQAAHGYVQGDTGTFIVDLATEAVTGALLGFLVYGVFAAVQSAGALLDISGGFQAAQQYDPAADIDGAQFSRLYQTTALALLFASDGYQLVIGGLVRSFASIPLTTSVDWNSVAQTLTDSITQMLVAALQIAGPIMVVLFLANVALGLLTRVAPALNVYSLGPPALALTTVVLSGISIVALPNFVDFLAQQASRLIAGAS